MKTLKQFIESVELDEVSTELVDKVRRARFNATNKDRGNKEKSAAFRKNTELTTARDRRHNAAADADPEVRKMKQAANAEHEYNKSRGFSNEEVEPLEEKNVPTHPDKWARAKSAAKSKFAVYPSAYANGWASKKYKAMGGGWKSVKEELEEIFDIIESMVEETALKYGVDSESIWEELEQVSDEELIESAAWQRSAGKDPKGGLNRKGVASYRRENPGSKLKMAVTTPPSKLKPGSKAANRRKSFCARMGGVKGPMKKPNGEPSRKALALRKWNC